MSLETVPLGRRLARLLDARIVALVFLAGYQQIAYFLPEGAIALPVALGIAFFLLAVLLEKIDCRFSKIQWRFLSIILSMNFLTLILAFVGNVGELEPRALWVLFAAQLIIACLVFELSAAPCFLSAMLVICGTIFFLELIILIGQFGYDTFGLGFAKFAEREGATGFLSGSMGNPNNAATALGLLCMALTSILAVQGRFGLAYLVLFASLVGLFLTLSRTMILFAALNFAALWRVHARSKSRRGEMRTGTLWRGVVVAVALIGVWFLYEWAAQRGWAVFDRSVEKLGTISTLGEDRSASFRALVHLRLLENLPSLGFGALMDRSYGQFFNISDPWLLTVNPHSYLVEFAFLFGYPGLLVVLLFGATLLRQIWRASGIPWEFKLLATAGLLFGQAVPSSLLQATYFIVPFLVLWPNGAYVRMQKWRLMGGLAGLTERRAWLTERAKGMRDMRSV